MTKKCKSRSWPFAKFNVACRARATRLGIKIKTSGLQKAYDDALTIPYACELLTIKSGSDAK